MSQITLDPLAGSDPGELGFTRAPDRSVTVFRRVSRTIIWSYQIGASRMELLREELRKARSAPSTLTLLEPDDDGAPEIQCLFPVTGEPFLHIDAYFGAYSWGQKFGIQAVTTLLRFLSTNYSDPMPVSAPSPCFGL